MKIVSCKFNMDTACVELKYSDGTMIAIDIIAVENEVADDLILNGDPEKYLKAVTQYKPLDS